jgi:UPF0176 protein
MENTTNNQYKVILYYCYSEIEKPDEFRDQHHLLCLDLNLRGRIIIASEGLNGTVSGSAKEVDEYMKTVKSDPRFADIEFKEELVPDHTFKKLHVRVKDEIVHSSLKEIDPTKKTGAYVEPDQLREMIKNQDDFVILDVRSNYEHKLGKFKNAVTLDIDNFRDFPDKINELEQYKGKKIVTYCTYVFDSRLAVDVNKVNPKVVSKCYVCDEPSDRMVNCANPTCNIHVPICEACGEEMEGACSVECKEHPEKRPYDGTGYYQKESNGYNPYKGFQRRNLLKEKKNQATT